MRILVVDDSNPHRRLLTALFTRAGHEVMTAPDGVAALALLETSAVDAVVSDVRMPRMDGVEATRLIRHRYPSVQVVGLSVNAAHFAEALRWAGAVAVLNKDGDHTRLIEAIRAIRPSRN